MLVLAPAANAYYCDCEFCRMYPNSDCFNVSTQSGYLCYWYVFDVENQCFSGEFQDSSNSESEFLAQLRQSAELTVSK